MIKCAIYARVSTLDKGQDTNNQLIPLRKFAEALNYEVYAEYVDYCSGGDSNRPKFQELLAEAKRSAFNVILVWSLDRFSREGILNTLGYLKMLKSHNVGLKSYQETWLDTSEAGMSELLLAIFSWVAQQERERLSERIKAALRHKKNVGKRGKDKKPRKKGGYYLRFQKTK